MDPEHLEAPPTKKVVTCFCHRIIAAIIAGSDDNSEGVLDKYFPKWKQNQNKKIGPVVRYLMAILCRGVFF